MRSSVVVLAAAGTACTLFTPFGTDLTGGDPNGPADASTFVDAPAASDVSQGGDASALPDGAPCIHGAPVRALRVFDASPMPGFVCAPENALDSDGKLAGLDRGDVESSLDGTAVTGCLALEFPDALDQVVIRAQPTSQGCLTMCSGNCGSGHEMGVFTGTTASDLKKALVVDLSTLSLMDYAVPVVSDTARVIAVCRLGWCDSRDDIAIDAVTGRCR